MFFGSGGLESRLARFIITPIRTATKRASGGKAANNKTAGRRLGPKKGEGEFVEAGQIIWRQRGTKWFPGENAGIGRDHTIFAREPGFVRYYRDPFHAKRRFIGIALGHDARLPTPHFEPRRRRFGYTPIDNEEVAQFELDFLTRKETKRLAIREEILAQRAEAKAKRTASYEQVIKDSGFTGQVDAQQLNRLDSIYQFICGGLSRNDATEMVDNVAREDFDIELRTGRITSEEHAAKVAAYEQAANEIDGIVGFGLNRKLAALKDIDEKVRENAIKTISDLASPHLESPAGTPGDVVSKILEIIQSSAVFSASDAAHLKSRFLRRPLPILVTKDNKAELEQKAKKSEGEIRNVWDAEKSGLKRYFVPKGGKLIF